MGARLVVRVARALIGLATLTATVAATACDRTSIAATAHDSTTTSPPPVTAALSAHDWTRFGFDVGRSSASPDSIAIDSTNAASLTRTQISIDGTVDAAAIFLHGVTVAGASHDVLFVTTTYGKTVAIDASSGTTLWEFTPPGYSSFAGSAQITTTTPVADPSRQFIYAASPDGSIRKLAVADGRVVWTTPITTLPAREKIASPLNFDRGHVIAVTGGYIGDAAPYQGHVSVLDASNGGVLHTWNSLCSDRAGLLTPSSCSQSGSAIWGRAGAVIDSATGEIYVTTGNARWDGLTNWGDAVLALDANATHLIGNYTPANTQTLNNTDADLGSTSPVLLGGGLVAQGGKDGHIRVLKWSDMRGTVANSGGEVQLLSTPSGNALFTAPAVWRASDGTWVFAADGGGTQAWKLSGGQLTSVWRNGNSGTSPVVAGGLVFVYDPGGSLRIYTARGGNQVARLTMGSGHWNSPIVVDRMVMVPEGNANSHQTSGVIDVFRLP
ncbi:MAG TPA: PQQ-binding-like beta-propeller repeat protein [Gemmatimonadaceae bacterium]|nr:PQQ-binding-like beta-propeller repeat protein [Gemmatimonadaceae bacterium]